VFDFSSDSDRSRSKHRHKPEKNQKPKEEEEVKEKEKPCFVPSGILAEFTNKVNGVVLKFSSPLDASPPTTTWGLYPFDGNNAQKSVNLRSKDSTTSAFLCGTDKQVSHIVLSDPSCSKQHAVIQFRKRLKTVELTPEEMTARGRFEALV
jgi:smad nuclear-interacting protein 1